tara:strand:+ start:610 stop:912 length:303 start_codon:yes stop_codon:yes gene_type:complete
MVEERYMLSAREKKEKKDYAKLEKLRLAYKDKKKISKADVSKANDVTSPKTSSAKMYSSRNRTPDSNNKAFNSGRKIPKLGSKRKPIDKLLSDIQRILKR